MANGHVVNKYNKCHKFTKPIRCRTNIYVCMYIHICVYGTSNAHPDRSLNLIDQLKRCNASRTTV